MAPSQKKNELAKKFWNSMAGDPLGK
ncbi:hypothetical protein CCACVL1_26522 [Corchorus capsularis]|uniref:Uncharacterized protein n=1 Tax=Corchorus capsularis TaxID=210143 RepID=A0A1R3GEE2_COCAP|nr:hypothetical protein CCACVL1_26522 [Corchorus capsularis]